LDFENNGLREQAAESEHRYQAVLQEMKAVKEERDDAMDRASALSISLSRKARDEEATERGIRREADQRIDAEKKNMLRSLEAEKLEITERERVAIEALTAKHREEMARKQEDCAVLSSQLESLRKEMDGVRRRTELEQEMEATVSALESERDALRNKRAFWMKHSADREAERDEMAHSVRATRRQLLRNEKRLGEVTRFANGIWAELQSMRRLCRCGNARDDLQTLLAMERAIKEKDAVIGQLMHFLFGQRKQNAAQSMHREEKEEEIEQCSAGRMDTGTESNSDDTTTGQQ